jgi:glycerol-3-phosphate dehydrogenase
LLLADVGAALGATQAARLWSVYGAGAAAVAKLAKERDLGAPLDAGGGVLAAELVYAREAEWAQTLDDILQRRCMAGLGADFGLGAAEPAARALERLGIWDAARAAQELADYRAHALRQRALGSAPPRRTF